jgi:hypothetical protein
MSYKGRYTPQNPQKYRGDHRNIIYRSLWERKFMVYCDQSDNIIEWGSEEVIIPYISPLDGRMHRYFPEFIIEVKPKRQCNPPNPNPSRRTRRWISEIRTWGVNEAKWKSAVDWCDNNGMEFKILTEDDLGIRYK